MNCLLRIERSIKRLIGKKPTTNSVRFAYIMQDCEVCLSRLNREKRSYFNDTLIETDTAINSGVCYIGDNAMYNLSLSGQLPSASIHQLDMPCDIRSAPDAWRYRLEHSVIDGNFRNSGLCFTAYNRDKEQYCLSSWIWTTAATVRCLTNINCETTAKSIADTFLIKQDVSGGWVVREDYSAAGISPMLAPNDSAYIARNALLTVFKITGDNQYLDAAIKCARWIMTTVRPDGLVSNGYDTIQEVWKTKGIIIDTGFTADLFAELYTITKAQEYKAFLERFCEAYTRLFFDRKAALFSTVLTQDYKRKGGYFSRGQAWALEGMISAFRVINSEWLHDIIEATVKSLIKNQNRNGAWPYNISRKYYGDDCKGTAIIAKAIWTWKEYSESKERIIACVQKALKWCEEHTEMSGEAAGLIFCFSAEGAVTKDYDSSTAFLYSTAYAYELMKEMGNV